MSNYSDLPTHDVAFSSTVIIATADKDKDEDGDVHGFVDDNNDADDDALNSIDDISCMSAEDAYLEPIRVGLYNFVVESTYNDLKDFGPPPVAVSTATKDGIDDDDSDHDHDDEISTISHSSSIRDSEVVIVSSLLASYSEKQNNNSTNCSAEEEEETSSLFSSYFPNTNPEYDNNDETTPSCIDLPIVMNNYHRSDDDDTTTLSYISSSNVGCSTLLQRRRKRRRRSHSNNNSVHIKIEYIQHQAMKPIRRASTVASWSARRLRAVLHNPFLFQQKTKNKRKKNQSVLLSTDYHDACLLSIAPTMIPVESFELGSDEEERNARSSHHDH